MSPSRTLSFEDKDKYSSFKVTDLSKENDKSSFKLEDLVMHMHDMTCICMTQ